MGAVMHNIPPVFNAESRVLVLGSFPSVQSRAGQFFYHHPQNRFWRVLAAVFGVEVPQSVPQKRALLLRNGVALWDVLAACEITGSSDASIKNAVPNDFSALLAGSRVTRVFTNGQAAHRLYGRFCAGLALPETVLPSTSPANAAWSLERLVEAWKILLTD